MINSLAILLFFLFSAPGFSQYRNRDSAPPEEQPVGGAAAEEDASSPEEPAVESVSSTLPTFLSLAANVNDFGRFADSGPDSNWYIGFNNAWIIKLPPVPAGGFRRAFIGAKIGRAKSLPKQDRPWELSVIPGKIYMAISPVPSFPSERSFFLTDTEDAPLESNDKVYVPGTGPSRWFWAEVPLSMISADRPNYLIIWSPTREFKDAEHSPILASMEASPSETADEPRAWNNHSIQGVPPRSESGTLQVPIKIKPALALKLVPATGLKVKVGDFTGRSLGDDIFARFSVEGKDIESAWIELSQDELEWHRITPYLHCPPYEVTIPRSLIPARGGYLRARARNTMAVEGGSKAILVTTHGGH